jgi:hypothetical protein
MSTSARTQRTVRETHQSSRVHEMHHQMKPPVQSLNLFPASVTKEMIAPPPDPGKFNILTPKMTPNHNRIMTQLPAASELLTVQSTIVAKWRKHIKTLTGPYYRVGFLKTVSVIQSSSAQTRHLPRPSAAFSPIFCIRASSVV